MAAAHLASNEPIAHPPHAAQFHVSRPSACSLGLHGQLAEGLGQKRGEAAELGLRTRAQTGVDRAGAGETRQNSRTADRIYQPAGRHTAKKATRQGSRRAQTGAHSCV
jgi:hypothetical protein